MIRKALFFILFLSFGSSPGFSKDWAKEGWDFLYEKDEIRVFRKNFPQSAVKGVAGETMVEASPGKIIFLLMDHEHKGEWIENFGTARTVEDMGADGNVQYSVFDLPFPVSDRDFLVRNEFSIDPAQKAIIVDIKSVTHKNEPEQKGLVRGEVVQGRFVLIPHGSSTIVQAEYLTDPKGLLPNWLINMLQKQWPYKTLEAMKLQLKKPFVKEWEPYLNHWKPKLDSLEKKAG